MTPAPATEVELQTTTEGGCVDEISLDRFQTLADSMSWGADALISARGVHGIRYVFHEI